MKTGGILKIIYEVSKVEMITYVQPKKNKKHVFKDKFYKYVPKPVNQKVDSKVKISKSQKETKFIPRQRSGI